MSASITPFGTPRSIYSFANSDIEINGNVNANQFIGDGQNITNINIDNINNANINVGKKLLKTIGGTGNNNYVDNGIIYNNNITNRFESSSNLFWDNENNILYLNNKNILDTISNYTDNKSNIIIDIIKVTSNNLITELKNNIQSNIIIENVSGILKGSKNNYGVLKVGEGIFVKDGIISIEPEAVIIKEPNVEPALIAYLIENTYYEKLIFKYDPERGTTFDNSTILKYFFDFYEITDTSNITSIGNLTDNIIINNINDVSLIKATDRKYEYTPLQKNYLYFNGTENSYADFDSNFDIYKIYSNNLNEGGNTIGITFSFWFKICNDISNDKFLYFFSNANTSTYRFEIKIIKENNFKYLAVNIREGFDNEYIITDINIDANIWYHFVWSIDENLTWTLYINSGSNPNFYVKKLYNKFGIDINANYTKKHIAKASHKLNTNLNCSISDLRIYNKELTTTEIFELFKLNEYTLYKLKFNDPNYTTCDILLIAGGGGGTNEGGGGAGELVYMDNVIIKQNTHNSYYEVKVGRGGAGKIIKQVNDENIVIQNNTKGIDTSFGTLLANGGGSSLIFFGNGGSGSGNGGSSNLNTIANDFEFRKIYFNGNNGFQLKGGGGGSGKSGEIYNGGDGIGIIIDDVNNITYNFKNIFDLLNDNDIGYYNNSTDLIYFAGGGASNIDNSYGGLGGGGNGSTNYIQNITYEGRINTGSGGGGYFNKGYSGGSGIVLLRYLKTELATNSIGNELRTASNNLLSTINNLTTDNIIETNNSKKKFIIDNIYNNDLLLNGTLVINSNLIVHGDTTILNTDIYTSEKINISNFDNEPAFHITQVGDILHNNNSIFTINYNNNRLFTLLDSGSLGLGINNPENSLLNIIEKYGCNIISASNLSREVFTLANDGSLGLGVVDPQSTLINIKQINYSNIISASNLSREVFTLTNDGILGIGVNNPNKQSMLDVNGNINIVDNNNIGYIYTINNRDIIKDTCNYVIIASNIISKRITDLSADNIADGTINKFIINNKYQNDLEIIGDLKASNLIIYGEKTIIYTDIYTTEQLEVENKGLGPALNVKQLNSSYSIFNASNSTSEVFTILTDGSVGIGGIVPSVNNLVEVRGNVNIVSQQNEDFKFTINDRDIIRETSNYVLATSNYLNTDYDTKFANTTNYLLATSNYLNTDYDTKFANTTNYLLATSNYLNTDYDNKFANTTNYLLATSNYLNTDYDTKFANTTNYLLTTSNYLNTDYNIKFANTTNYLLATSNYLNTDYDNKFANTTNYLLATSNYLNTDYDTKFANTTNYLLATSNYLNTDYDNKFANTTNYLLETSNIISKRITDLSADNIADGTINKFIINNKYQNDLEIIGDLKASNLIIYGEKTIIYTDIYTTEQLEVDNKGLGSALNVKQLNSSYSIFNASNSTSEVFTILTDGSVGIGGIVPSANNLVEIRGNVNIVSQQNEDFKFTINDRDIIEETSNYVLAISNYLNTDYDTKFANTTNYLLATSNYLNTDYNNKFANTTNYLLATSNYLNTDYDTKFANTTNYLLATCNYLNIDYDTKFANTTRLLLFTSNYLNTDYDTKFANTTNYLLATCNYLNIDYDTKFANTTNYLLATSNYLNTDYDTKFANTNSYLSQTSNIISKRITDLNADYIADGTINKFIINNKYQNDLEIIGDLKASNLIIYGEKTILYTDIYTTEQLEVENKGLGTALNVKQLNSSYSIFNASNSASEVFTILTDGSVGIGGIVPSANNLVEVRGNVNIVSQQNEDFKFTINDRDIIGETSNYVLAISNYLNTDYNSKFTNTTSLLLSTSNYLNTDYDNKFTNTTSLLLSTSNYLNTDYDNKFANTTNYLLATSNYLNTDYDTKFANTTNYLLATSNYLNTDYDTKFANTTNYLLATSNYLNTDYDTKFANTTNYLLATSNYLNTDYDTKFANTTNYLLATSNYLNTDYDTKFANTTNYLLASSNYLNTDYDTKFANTTNYLLATSNYLNTDYNTKFANTTNYLLVTSNYLNTDYNNKFANTTNYLLVTSNYLNTDYNNKFANTTNYLLATSNYLNTDYDTKFANTTNYLLATSNYLNTDYNNKFANTTNYLLATSNYLNTDYDTKFANTTNYLLTTSNYLNTDYNNKFVNTTNYLLTTSNYLNTDYNNKFVNTTNYLLTTSNYLNTDYNTKFANTTNYLLATSNYLNTDYDTKFSNTTNYLLATSNYLNTDYDTKFANTTNYLLAISNYLNTDYDTKFANTTDYLLATSNIISNRITYLSADNIADGTINKFIINNKYQNDLEIIGDLKASNLIIYGEKTILYTDIYTTEQLEVENKGLGSALNVKQLNSSYSIFNASNSTSEVFTILTDGSVGIGGIVPSANNLVEIRGNVNIVSQQNEDFKFTINDRDIIGETSNYVLVTSNYLNTDYDTKFANTSSLLLFTSNYLNIDYNTKFANTTNYLLATSNYLNTDYDTKFANTTNYLLAISNYLNIDYDTKFANTTNYLLATSNYLNTDYDTKFANTTNYLLATSNYLNTDYDTKFANTTNYLLATSNYLNTDYDTKFANTTNYLLAISNYLNIDYDTKFANTTNYLLATSNYLNTDYDTKFANTTNYLLAISNYLNIDYDTKFANTTNYLLATSNYLNTDYDTKFANTTNYLLATSNYLNTDYDTKFANTTNYLLATSNYLNTDYDTKFANTTNYLLATSNYLNTDYDTKFANTTNYLLATSNYLNTDYDNKFANTTNYLLATSNYLNIDYDTKFANTTNYLLATSNYLNTYYDTKFANTTYYLSETSNIISKRITDLSADNIANGTINKFIINNKYQNDLEIIGDLKASNLIIYGEKTILYTDIYTTEQLEVENKGLGSALNVKQLNSSYSIFNASNSTSEVFTILTDGSVGIGGIVPSANNLVEVRGNVNIVSQQNEDFKFTINDRDIIGETSNYVLVTSNYLNTDYDTKFANTTNYLLVTSNYLNTDYDTKFAITTNYLLATSNYLNTDYDSKFAITTNYLLVTSNYLNTDYDTKFAITTNYLLATSNYLNTDYDNKFANTTNYLLATSNYLNTDYDTKFANTTNYLLATSNYLNTDYDTKFANTTNYLLATSNYLNTDYDTKFANTTNYLLATSNYLNTDYDTKFANTTNYLLAKSNYLNTEYDTKFANTTNYLLATSNYLNTDYDTKFANTTNYLLATSNYLNTDYDTKFVNTTNYLFATSNYLNTDYDNKFANTTNYLLATSNYLNTDYDTKFANTTNYLFATSYYLNTDYDTKFANTTNYLLATSNYLNTDYDSKFANTTNYLLATSNYLNTDYDTKFANTTNYLLATSNYLNTDYNTKFANTTNYLLVTSNYLNTDYDTKFANTTNYLLATSNYLNTDYNTKFANTTNYLLVTSNYLNTDYDTKFANTTNYLLVTSNYLNTDYDTKFANTTNYLLVTSNYLNTDYDTKFANTTNYLLATSNYLNTDYNTKFANTTSYLSETSNIISKRIKDLTADNIADGTINKFIINNKYQNNLEIIGDLKASNLIIYGEKTILYTDIYTTEQFEVENKGLGSALNVKQLNSSYSIFNASNSTSEVFTILTDGSVGIGGIVPSANNLVEVRGNVNIVSRQNEDFKFTINDRDIIGETSNYLLATCNYLNTDYNTKFTNTTNYLLETSNYLNTDYDTKLANTTNYLLATSNYLNIDYDTKFANTTNYLLATSNYLNTDYDTKFANTTNYLLETSNYLNTDYETKFANTNNFIVLTSNTIIQNINTNIKTSNIAINNNTYDEALSIKQYVGSNIVSISNINTEVFTIKNDGKIGINNSSPQNILDVYGNINASSYTRNGYPLSLEFSQGMIIQTKHLTYSKTEVKNGFDWEPINNDINNGFVISIKPSDITSKILISTICHIGMEYETDSRWWGIRLYRKIGNGYWTHLSNANGIINNNDNGTSCWISHNLGAESSTYSHFITNVTGTFQDIPNTTEIVYYTAYWKNRLGELNNGLLFLNKSYYMLDNNYPCPSSSWTATEIWNKGETYIAPINSSQIQINANYNTVGIDIFPPIDQHKLNVNGSINVINGTYNINGIDVISNTSNILMQKINELLNRIILLENK